MSMKKGYCIKCRSTNPKRHIFNVNSDAVKCYCPRCMAEYKPKVAINNFNRFIENMQVSADISFKIARLPDISYQKYADVLEYESDYVPALLGRISSLILVSTLRHSRFYDAMQLITLDSNKFHANGCHEQYVHFLKSANQMANDYKDRMFKSLTFRSYFYDVDCIRLYVLRMDEIHKFKKFLAEELAEIEEAESFDLVNKEAEEIDDMVHHEFVTADGHKHSFITFEIDNYPLISTSDEMVKTGVEKYRPSTLDENDRKLRYIKDQIFRSNKALSRIVNFGLVFGVGLGTIGTILIIIGLFFTNNKLVFWPLFITGAVLIFVSVISVIVQAILRVKLKKSRY